jgi:tetratricopeptide (TPR) repeat protein
MALQKTKHYTELLDHAKAYEAEGELESAAENYEQVIKQHPLEEQAYSRLMIIYRKLKEPKKELKVINKGLDAFMEQHEKKLHAYSGNDAIGKLSKALLKSVSGKNLKSLDYPQPVPKWAKRKEALEKKLK